MEKTSLSFLLQKVQSAAMAEPVSAIVLQRGESLRSVPSVPQPEVRYLEQLRFPTV
jgi:hypothetical protein